MDDGSTNKLLVQGVMNQVSSKVSLNEGLNFLAKIRDGFRNLQFGEAVLFFNVMVGAVCYSFPNFSFL